MLQQNKATIAKVRDVFDSALDQCGLHMLEGDVLWNSCIDFELSLDEKHRDEDRITHIFNRFLETPFSPAILSAAKQRFIQWKYCDGEEYDIPKSITKSIERAERAYELRQEYEDALKTSREIDPQSNTLLSAYFSYIDLEISGGDHNRVRIMFERALVDFPVLDFLWKSLLTFEELAGRTEDLSDIVKRALRNTPWSGDIWVFKLRSIFLNCYQDPLSCVNELNAAVEDARAVIGGNPAEFQKVLIALASYWRQSRTESKTKYEEVLQSGLKLLRDHSYIDPEHRLATLLSASQATQGTVESGRSVWESLVADTAIDATYSGTWMSYYEYLSKFGADFASRRDIFARACKAHMSLDDQAFLAKAWIALEEAEGSIETQKEAFVATANILRNYEATQRGIACDIQQVNNSLHDIMKQKKRQENDPNFGVSKRKRDENTGTNSKKKKAKSANEKKPLTSHDSLIIFVKHIVPSATEEDLFAEFSESGSDIDITIGKDPKTDRSKGYAYIRCGSQDTFDKLCALNGKEYQGKALFIAPSAPPKGHQKHKSKQNVPVPNSEPPEPRERTQKQRLAPVTMLVPRAAAVATAPKSNEEFRKMFLSRKTEG